jgi:rhodanese-related sulfurtransferase
MEKKTGCSIVLLIAILSPTLSASSAQNAHVVERRRQLSGPLCGVDCVYRALGSLGHADISFDTLIDTRYVSSINGSSGQDLLRLIRESGGTGSLFANWGRLHLQLIESPTILHVSNEIPGAYNDRQYLVYDSTFGLEHWTASELLSRWDGTGVMLDNSTSGKSYPLESDATMIQAICAMAACAALLFTGMALNLIRFLLSPQFNSLFVALVVILLLASTAVTGYRRTELDIPYLAWVESHYLDLAIPEISREQLEILMRDSSKMVTVVDTRRADSFNAGNIDGSVSIPIDASPEHFRHCVHALTHDTPIVCYCDNESCRIADEVAKRLRLCTFQVAVYRRGWKDWNGR